MQIDLKWLKDVENLFSVQERSIVSCVHVVWLLMWSSRVNWLKNKAIETVFHTNDGFWVLIYQVWQSLNVLPLWNFVQKFDLQNLKFNYLVWIELWIPRSLCSVVIFSLHLSYRSPRSRMTTKVSTQYGKQYLSFSQTRENR